MLQHDTRVVSQAFALQSLRCFAATAAWPARAAASPGHRLALARQQRAAQDAMVGRRVGVLFEKAGRMPGQMVGKSDHLHAVHVTGDVAIGDLRQVEIIESGPNSLAGQLISS